MTTVSSSTASNVINGKNICIVFYKKVYWRLGISHLISVTTALFLDGVKNISRYTGWGEGVALVPCRVTRSMQLTRRGGKKVIF